VAVFDGFPPFAHRVGGALVGSDLQLLNKFAEGEQWKTVFHSRPFEGLWDLVGDEIFDLAAGGLSTLKSRDAIWSEPYADVRRSALILARNKPFLEDYADIRRFAAVPGSAAHAHAEKHLPRTSTVFEVQSIDEGVRLLLDGAVEAVGTGSVSASFQQRRSPALHMVDLHRSADRAEEIAFAVRNNPLLLHKINQFILSLKTPQI
jgi:ABC-type amino acid transport substrate-binding protein